MGMVIAYDIFIEATHVNAGGGQALRTPTATPTLATLATGRQFGL